MKDFLKAERVWTDQNDAVLQIEIKFRASGALLKIACESDYAVYLDGSFVYAGAYKAPYGKLAFDSISLAGRTDRESVLLIVAVHFDRGSSIHKSGKAAFLYELTETDGGKVLAYSRAGNRAEICPWAMFAEYCITGQLGGSFRYDLTKKRGRSALLSPSENTDELIARPVKLCEYSASPRKVTAQGKYLSAEGNTPAEKIFNAWFRPYELQTLAGIHEWGRDLPSEINLPERSYLLIDLGAERTGNIFFDIDSSCRQEILIGYGEHLDDLRPRTYVNGRYFAFSYLLKKGKNSFVQPFGRMGGRYLVCLFEKNCTVRDLGIKEYHYPLKPLPFTMNDDLAQKIYDVAARTNLLCMHVHYEDCPWREQAFYGMDARNQMLYGYYIFGESEFPLHALELFFSTQRKDGLFELCAPSEIGTTIPSFSLFAVMAAAEYYQFTRDGGFIIKYREVIERCLDAFCSRIEENDLLPRFYQKEYWNFYEWSAGLDGGDIFRKEDQLPVVDLPLNALLAIVLEEISSVYTACGISSGYSKIAKRLISALETNFYDESEGAFASFLYQGEKSGYDELSQVLMLYLRSEKSSRISEIILERKYPSVTIAYLGFKYEALLRFDEKNSAFVFSDIKEIFGKMLFEGATSFYETEKGADDFEGAGSLCHAWASVPAYLYRKYLTGVDYSADTESNPIAESALKALCGEYAFHGKRKKF